MTITHTLIDGKLHVYRRENSRFWQCSSYLAGRNHRNSTKTDSLERAKIIAEEWYFGLRLKERAGELKAGKTFREAAERFLAEYPIITQGERSESWVKQKEQKLRAIVLPFFGDKVLTDITAGLIQDYRIHRATTCKTGRPAARSTIHHEIVLIRQVLKTANRHGWLPYLPDLSVPYKTSGKVSHRAWFSPAEYKQLYEATRRRMQHPPKPRWKWQCEQFHDYVLFMVNTGLRPDEASRLEFRDVEIVEDRATGEAILEISVRGKRGVGYCKSMPSAVRPYERLLGRAKLAPGNRRVRRRAGENVDAETPKYPAPTDAVFPGNHIKLFNGVLSRANLKLDRDNNRRTAYSLRHTYICMRLMEGADIYQIAKNCRTSVEMIEKFYAAHIENTLMPHRSTSCDRNAPLSQTTASRTRLPRRAVRPRVAEANPPDVTSRC
jgi:integrase